MLLPLQFVLPQEVQECRNDSFIPLLDIFFCKVSLCISELDQFDYPRSFFLLATLIDKALVERLFILEAIIRCSDVDFLFEKRIVSQQLKISGV